MRRPAASPGRLLEAFGDGRPREMVAAWRNPGTEPGLQACSLIMQAVKRTRFVHERVYCLPSRRFAASWIKPHNKAPRLLHGGAG